MLTYIYTIFFVNLQFTHILFAVTFTYFLFYFYKVVHRPALVGADGGFKTLLLKNLSVLHERFWPTFWAFTNHHQTILRAILKSKPFVPYERVTLKTPDHGEINLDYVYNDKDNQIFPDPVTRPTLIFMPGITGDSDDSYTRHILLEAISMGYRGLVFINRGLGEAKLKTPRTFCACNVEDLEFIVKHVTETFPQSPILFFSVSLGGVILTNYLTRVGEKVNANIVAALVVSPPWCSFGTTDSLEKPLNWLFYNRFIVDHLKSIVKKNWDMFCENESTLPYNLEEVMKVQTIRQFDECFTSRSFGFDTCIDYYKESSLALKPLENIKIPMLFLNAKDDPFSPFESIPIEAIKRNPNLALVVTDYGGHIGFIEGATLRDRSLVERLFYDYFSCIAQAKINEKIR